jgi:hypothetical protein
MASLCSPWSCPKCGHRRFRPLADEGRRALVYGADLGDREEIPVGRTGQDLPLTRGVGLRGVAEAVGTRPDQVDRDRTVALAGIPLGEDLAVERVVLLERHARADVDAVLRDCRGGGQRDDEGRDHEERRDGVKFVQHRCGSFVCRRLRKERRATGSALASRSV